MGPDNGLELKFALRSIHKNFVHDNFRIVIVGDKPDWITGVEHFQFNRVPEQQNRNFTDQLVKLYAVLTELDISSQFIWTYDDTYFTKKVKLADLKTLKAVTSFDKYPGHLDNSGAGMNWKTTLQNTMVSVLNSGGSNFNYETHLPRYFSKSRVLKLIDKFNLLGNPMMISSLYYNFYNKNNVPICLYDNSQRIRFLLRSTFDVIHLKKQMNKHLFTNNSPNTWGPVLKTVLTEMFPEKSKFEI